MCTENTEHMLVLCCFSNTECNLEYGVEIRDRVGKMVVWIATSTGL